VATAAAAAAVCWCGWCSCAHASKHLGFRLSSKQQELIQSKVRHYHALPPLLWLISVCTCLPSSIHLHADDAGLRVRAAAALNSILGRWGWKAARSPAWNISGEPCSGAAVDDGIGLDGNSEFNPGIKCDCSFNSNTVCHITMLYVCPV
jgi:hypothetical protein